MKFVWHKKPSKNEPYGKVEIFLSCGIVSYGVDEDGSAWCRYDLRPWELHDYNEDFEDGCFFLVLRKMSYKTYTVDEKKVLGIDLEDEQIFLQELTNQMNALENANILYTSCNATPMVMTFQIYSAEGPFSEQHIKNIVTILVEIGGSLKFTELRHLSWCSGYDMGECVKEHLEFNWLNQSKNRTHKDNTKIVKLSDNICNCMICNFRFE